MVTSAGELLGELGSTTKTWALQIKQDMGPIAEGYATAAAAATTKGAEVVTATGTMATGVKTKADEARTAFGTMTTGFVTSAGTAQTQVNTLKTTVSTALAGMKDDFDRHGAIGNPLKTGIGGEFGRDCRVE